MVSDVARMRYVRAMQALLELEVDCDEHGELLPLGRRWGRRRTRETYSRSPCGWRLTSFVHARR
jgi:hypothetical protein